MVSIDCPVTGKSSNYKNKIFGKMNICVFFNTFKILSTHLYFIYFFIFIFVVNLIKWNTLKKLNCIYFTFNWYSKH